MTKINPKAVAGRKKLRFQFLPIDVLEEVAGGMAEGADKYGAYNWRDTEIQMSDYYDSTMRHVTAWFKGEDIDPDSNIHHLSKAIAGLVVVRDAIMTDSCIDDRPLKRNKQNT